MNPFNKTFLTLAAAAVFICGLFTSCDKAAQDDPFSGWWAPESPATIIEDGYLRRESADIFFEIEQLSSDTYLFVLWEYDDEDKAYWDEISAMIRLDGEDLVYLDKYYSGYERITMKSLGKNKMEANYEIKDSYDDITAFLKMKRVSKPSGAKFCYYSDL